MSYVVPSFHEDSFTCPFCNVYSKVDKHLVVAKSMSDVFLGSEFTLFRCQCCGKASIWQGDFSKYITDYSSTDFIYPANGHMIYPIQVIGAPPVEDMPDDVRKDYLEAREIASLSPRSACALLRLALQKLMVHLGETGQNINKDIRSLAEKDILSPKFIKLMDTLRLFGNDSVHPGEIREEDIGENIDKMFLILNKIVEGAISDQKMFDELYQMTPETKRTAAEEQDQRNKTKEQ